MLLEQVFRNYNFFLKKIFVIKTCFSVILTKTYISFLSTLSLYSIMVKLRRKSHNLSKKSFFWTSKPPFVIHSFLASCNVCPVTIPEICAQTQGSYYRQLIHWNVFLSLELVIRLFERAKTRLIGRENFIFYRSATVFKILCDL